MESRIFLWEPGKSVVNFHWDAVCTEFVVDKLKHGLGSVLVRFFKMGVFMEDLTYSLEELSLWETECTIVVKIIHDVSYVFE